MLLDAGAQIKPVQDYLGHADIRSTMVYAASSENQRRDGSERLDAGSLAELGLADPPDVFRRQEKGESADFPRDEGE